MEDMSRGMQQKVAIARPSSRRRSCSCSMSQRQDWTRTRRGGPGVRAGDPRRARRHVLLAAHDMLEADALCDRIAIVDKGGIVALGTASELKALVPVDDGSEPTLEDVFSSSPESPWKMRRRTSHDDGRAGSSVLRTRSSNATSTWSNATGAGKWCGCSGRIANSLAVVFIARSVNSTVGADALSEGQVNRVMLFLAVGALVWHYLAVVFETVSDMVHLGALGRGRSSTPSWRRDADHAHGRHVALLARIRARPHCRGARPSRPGVPPGHEQGELRLGHVVLLAGSLSLVGIGIMGAVLPLLSPNAAPRWATSSRRAGARLRRLHPGRQDAQPLATMSMFSPATYIIEGIRGALIDGNGVTDLWRDARSASS